MIKLQSREEYLQEEDAADEYFLDLFGWIDPEKLLPDRSGDFKVLIESDNNVHTSRFNKKVLFSYWSIEHFCHEKITGWKPIDELYINDNNE